MVGGDEHKTNGEVHMIPHINRKKRQFTEPSDAGVKKVPKIYIDTSLSKPLTHKATKYSTILAIVKQSEASTSPYTIDMTGRLAIQRYPVRHPYDKDIVSGGISSTE